MKYQTHKSICKPQTKNQAKIIFFFFFKLNKETNKQAGFHFSLFHSKQEIKWPKDTRTDHTHKLRIPFRCFTSSSWIFTLERLKLSWWWSA